jgi:hypothetical protein
LSKLKLDYLKYNNEKNKVAKEKLKQRKEEAENLYKNFKNKKSNISINDYLEYGWMLNITDTCGIEKLYELGKSKLGISKSPSYRNNFNTQEKKTTINYTYLKELLLNIEKLDNQQQKGYAFERYLIDLFNAFSLEPRTSYRTEYNQIDGSIILNGSTVLIEAKYKETPINKDPFILFSEKIENKSPFTKGIFITLTRPSDKTLEYFNDKTSRFIIFTVEELYILCDQNRSLEEILKKKFRLLEETGRVFHHILQL